MENSAIVKGLASIVRSIEATAITKTEVEVLTQQITDLRYSLDRLGLCA